jgi:NADH-quinone oxidoreductase subunit N
MAVPLAAEAIPTPHIEYAQLSPVLIVFGAAIIGILAEAFLPRAWRYAAQLGITVVGLAASFAAVVALAADGYAQSKAEITAMGAVAVDGPALFLQGTIVLIALVAAFTFAERRLDPVAHGNRVDSFAAQGSAVPGSEQEKKAVRAGFTTTEVFPLLLFAVAGMMIFPAANDLLTLFVSLEVFSLPLYLLCALARRRRLLSQESAVKYFLLGAFSSAFLLFGVALLYGYAGTVSYGGIADVIDGSAKLTPALANSTGNDALLLIGGAMVVMGLLFKVGAVPFHMWTPDVYQGAPTPVTGFMAAATKVAAFGALLRLLYVVLPGLRWDWRPVMWAVAIVTMVIGAIVAVTQTDVKRLLAYSSIAHAGFLLAGVVAISPKGVSSVLFYLVAYSFVTLGGFAVVTLVRDAGGEATHLSKWAGPRAAFAAGRRGLRDLPAVLRRHPADRRLRGEVRGLLGRRPGGRRPAGRHRCDRLRGRGVLLHPGHRLDVLQRTPARGPHRRDPLPPDLDRHRRRRRRHPRPGPGAPVLPRPRHQGGHLRPLTRYRSSTSRPVNPSARPPAWGAGPTCCAGEHGAGARIVRTSHV